MFKIAVLMPIYNAEETLRGVFERIPNNIFREISEFILVNDGSKDDTQGIIYSLKQHYNYAKIIEIKHLRNLGYGAAQKTGFMKALADKMEIIVVLHADGQYPPEMIAEIIEPIKNGYADIVGGSRLLQGNVLKQGMPFLRYLGKIVLNKIENLVFKQKLTIYHEGYRAYKRSVLEIIDFNSYSDYFSFDSEMLIGAFVNKFRIFEIPIPTRYKDEECYLNPIKYIYKILVIILKYLCKRYNM